MSAERDIKSIVNNILKVFKGSRDNSVMRELAKFAIEMIVKRTRLGYGVSKLRGSESTRSSGITKVKLKGLSSRYIEYRKKYNKLSNMTTPRKSNLTFTGQLLKSMKIIKIGRGSVVIGPSGSRNDGLTNEFVGQDVAEKGRPFNDLYELEQKKLTRFYRKTFGDLLKKNKLLKY